MKLTAAVCLSIAVLTATTIPTNVPAATPGHGQEGLPNMDRRLARGGMPRPDNATLAQRAAAEARLRARMAHVQVDRAPISAGARWIADREGLLTGPDGQGGAMEGADPGKFGAPGDPHRVVKAFLNEHAAVFGHDASVLANARVQRDATGAHNGVRSTTWQQVIDGVPIHRGTLTAHVSRRGELITIGSEMFAQPAQAADAVQRQFVQTGGATPIAPEEACTLAAQNLGVTVEQSAWTIAVPSTGVERIQKLSGPGWGSPTRLALIWLPMDSLSVRLCWRVWMREPARQMGYELFVDATSGEIIWRRCVTEFASAPATYRVFTSESPTPFSPGYGSPVTNQPTTVARVLLNFTSLDSTASPNGWVDVGENQLRGNNAHAYYSKPTSETSWVGTEVTGNPSRVFDFPLDLTKSPDARGAAATVNAFYWVNLAHDKFYALGFDEQNRNCQETNFNRGGAQQDGISLHVNDPSSDDNASMTTFDDGESPWMSLGIYSGPNPDREAALDAEIMIHEYGHAVSNRLLGDGTGIDQEAQQTRGMGEGWSDFFAMAMTSASSDNVNGNYPKGAYCALHMWGSDYEANYYSGGRHYPYTTSLEKNPFTFKDIDPDQADPHYGVPANPILFGLYPGEPHNIGEVWCSMLWEARARLIQKHGFATGNQLMLQLVVDSLKLLPNNPSFTLARSGILVADTTLTGGANRTELWAAFAKRGLGIGASAPVSTNVFGVVESYDSLDALNVLPGSGFVVSGPPGGPFKPSAKAYTLTNDSASSISWRARAEPPLELALLSGSLAAHGSQSVSVSVNAAAAATLPQGAYSYSVFFTNQSTGVVLTRVISVAVGLSRVPAEFFFTEDHPNDLAHRTLWFEPDGTGTNYSVCRQTPSLTSFAINPATSQTLDFSNATTAVLSLTGGARFPFFGREYTELEIGHDGSIGPGAVDAPYDIYVSVFGHFASPRISAFRRSYDWTLGRVSWQQLSDQAVVTWENMDAYGDGKASFQLQLFFDGRIRLTMLDNNVALGLCGLSPGGGPPPLFAETDLSSRPSCTEPALAITLPASVTEGAGSAVGTVSIVGRPLAGPLTVSLSSSDTAEVTVPSFVTILAGESFAKFTLTILNDSARDGTQIAYITASHLGYTAATAPIAINDNETAVISLALPSTRIEGSIGTGSVTLSAPAAALVGVQLQSSRPQDLAVPPVVFVEPGESSVGFIFTTSDNNRIEGPFNVTVRASVANWTPGNDTVTILDNESTNLSLFTFIFQNEGAGTVTNGSTIQISGVLTTNLLVALISDDESEIRTPLFGGVILAGSTNTVLPLFMQDDSVIDGVVSVRLRALAGGFGPATNVVFVFDNDGPPEPYNPHPPHLAENVSCRTDLSWGRVEGDLIVNGNFETGDLAGWTATSTGAGSFLVQDGNYDPQSADGPLAPLAGTFSALSDQTGAGTQVLYQDVFIPIGATNVTLSWIERIRNYGGAFSSTHGFRVELRDTNDVVQAILFSTPTNAPNFSGPTSRSVNLYAWRGNWIRLAFVEHDNGGYLNVHLDEIHLEARSALPTFFDVYFGTNPIPGEAEFVGTTTNSSWALPPLTPATTWYWQLKSRRSTSTNAGPIWEFTTGGSPLVTLVIASNSTWRVLNTGVYPGSAWNDLGFNDSTWPTGLAKLGFGGDGENTVIGDPADGIVTFAFRRSFTVSHPEAVLGLTARLIRDDGAAVYVNGTRVWTDNLPARFTWTDQALTVLNDPQEKQWITNTFNPSLLVTGQNLIAVEVHQRHGTLTPSPDLGFAFELRATYDGANHAPAVVLTKPAEFSVIQLPSNVALAATATDTDSFGNVIGISKVEFFADGIRLGEDTTAAYTLSWTNASAGHHLLNAVVTDLGGLTSTSAPVNVLLIPPSGQSFATVIPPGAIWSYLDNGIYPGVRWTDLSFRDTRTVGWKVGPAQLGYGDGDEATVVSYGRNPLARHITTWFRHRFTPVVDITSLRLRVLRDDGIVVYLNGTEIARNNMPGGIVRSNTLAAMTISGSAENAWIEIPLADQVVVPLLNAGENVLAAEVHQASASSPDLSFDLELIATGNLRPIVALTSPANNTALLAPPLVNLVATATDPYGNVANVTFLRDGNVLGSASLPPWQFSWSNPPIGTHVLTAVATDNFGAIQTSVPVTLTIVPPVILAARLIETNLFELTWPLSAPGYRLQVTAALTPPVAWMTATNDVVQIDGVFRSVMPADGQKFFRLISP